jgi:hypothetical protein
MCGFSLASCVGGVTLVPFVSFFFCSEKLHRDLTQAEISFISHLFVGKPLFRQRHATHA